MLAILDQGACGVHVASTPEQKSLLLVHSFLRYRQNPFAKCLLALSEAAEVLAGMIDSLGKVHAFVPDSIHSTTWPPWRQSAGRSTDAHLLSLATAHKAKLATLDTGIPHAFLLP